MARVFCPWVLCKYNTSKVAKSDGECTKQDVLLRIVDDKYDGLDCATYTHDTSKIIEYGRD